jgi:hypothetical protein
MIVDTSEAVNAAVEVIRGQIGKIRDELAMCGDPVEVHLLERRMLEMLDRLSVIENNRFGVMIAFVAGRRGLDKIPAIELDSMVRAIAGRTPDKGTP